MRWYADPVRDYRKNCETRVRVETAILWLSLGLAIGGVAASLLVRFSLSSGAEWSTRNLALELANPGVWILIAVIAAAVSSFLARHKLRPLVRNIVMQESELQGLVEVAHEAKPSQSAIQEIAKFILIQQKLSALGEELECYNVNEDVRDEIDRAVARMTEMDLWRLMSSSDTANLVRAVPRQLRRAWLLSDRFQSRLSDQIACLSAPRCDLYLYRSPSGRVSVRWAQDPTGDEPTDDPVLIHPAWTVISSSVAPAVRSLGIVKEMINLLDHLDFNATCYLGLIELPHTRHEATEGRRIKLWTNLKQPEQDSVLSIRNGNYSSGMARIYSSWTTRDVTVDISLDEVQAIFSGGRFYIRRSDDETAGAPRLGPVFDFYYEPLDPAIGRGRFCIIDNASATDIAILEMYGMITPVFRRVVKEGLVPVDADPSVAVQVRVADTESKLYYIKELIDF